ncbi:MAG: proton-conducting transporter membrane subunit [Bacteroidales bacterium]
MVGPVYIIAVALGLAFLLGFLKHGNQRLSLLLMLVGVGFMAFTSAQWLTAHLSGEAIESTQFTAGFKPPFSISLQMGLAEATITGMINLFGLLGGLYLWRRLFKLGVNAQIIYLVTLMGLNVIVMTRDIFNLFVFFEVSSIGIVGLILLQQKAQALSSGFKYLMATGLISSFLLIGIIMIYRFSGTLYINDLLAANLGVSKGVMVSLFLLLMALILELKPFPANGWALDVYQSSHPGIGALLSGGFATAALFVLYKLWPIFPYHWSVFVAVLGGITFLASNLLGLKQQNAKRLLGYSSAGQVGLLLAVLGLQPVLGSSFPFIALTLLGSHFLAKSGLFWLAGIVNQQNIRQWSDLRKHPLTVVLFALFIFTLLGLPPFPSFFGKWQLIMELSGAQQLQWVVVILLGSFFEAAYLFRWFGYVLKEDLSEKTPAGFKHVEKFIGPIVFGLLSLLGGYYAALWLNESMLVVYIPLLFIAAIGLLDFLPAWTKNTLSIAAMAFYGVTKLPGLYEADLLRFIFMAIFIVGGILTLIAGYHYKGTRKGFYLPALLMFAGLGGIIEAQSLLAFFFSWELMTIGSYFLIIRGKRSMKHGLSYILFSLGGAYLLLSAFGLLNAQAGGAISAFAHMGAQTALISTLLAIGFMTKTASLGLHIWLPGAHAEAESDVSPMVSAILLKAGVFGLILTILGMGAEQAGGSKLLYALGWLGAITALVGNLAASLQEDAKRLLAYSSIGQLGYILFAFAMATHLGWMGGFVYVINHFAFKAVLFLTIGAVVLRVGTHNMYEMGGLIKRMPLAFIAVLMGIITLSGVPPLSGFAGKWFFYHALILKGWYFQGALILFAGIIAFLYSYRLIQTVFLGQLKDTHRQVKEISIWFLIPIYLLLAGIMVFSVKPDWILAPISNYLAAAFPSNQVVWDGAAATTSLGYWNGTWVMIIVGVMFMLILGWLLWLNAHATKVKQFNMVYSAERPFRPETTHMAHNMYAGYNKALGFLVAPGITRFWQAITDFTEDIADFVRRIYTGNGQTYALHIVAYLVIIYFVIF